MTDWRPISTAPEYEGDDPPRVLLWVADGGRDGKGTSAFGVAYRGKFGVRAKANGMLGDWKITHWAPEPEPPSP